MDVAYKTNDTIPWFVLVRVAHEKGYRVNSKGEMFIYRDLSPRNYDGSGPHITVWYKGRSRTLSPGRLAAYCHYGERALHDEQQVRYRDGNPANLAKDNVILTDGKVSQRAMNQRAKKKNKDRVHVHLTHESHQGMA